MLAVAACAALGFTAGTAPLPAVAVARAPAASMVAPLEKKFVYMQPKGPLSQNFAANMGDCAQIDVTKGYKRRIVPAEPTSFFSSFINDPPKPLDRTTPAWANK